MEHTKAAQPNRGTPQGVYNTVERQARDSISYTRALRNTKTMSGKENPYVDVTQNAQAMSKEEEARAESSRASDIEG